MRDPRKDPDAGSHYASGEEYDQALRDYCTAKLEKLERKVAKLRANRPKSGTEMAAMDIKLANLGLKMYELEVTLEGLE